MAIPTDRDTFQDYCLRALGEPVLQINLDQTQIDDRIDESIYMYQQYHMDAVVKEYYKHQITASTMVFSAPISGGPFINTEGLISASNTVFSGIVFNQANSTSIQFYLQNNNIPFNVGDTVYGTVSGARGTIANTTPGDMDNQFFSTGGDPTIIAVSRMLGPFENRVGVGDILFDPQAQFNMSLLANFTSTSLIPYAMGRSYQQMMNDMLRGRPIIRFQRHQQRIYVDDLLRRDFYPGQWLVFEAYRALDPDIYADIWSDRWLQRYCIALLKKNWGQNLSKYNGIALPGGVTLDGHTMYAEAKEEVEKLEEELHNTYQLPIDFFLG